MLKQRLLVVAVLLPLGIGMIWLGRLPFTLFLLIFLVLAAVEYVQLLRRMGAKPSNVLVVGGTGALLITRYYLQFQSADLLVSAIVLSAITVHLFAYENGRDLAATDFAATLGGIFYIGWVGSYLISLRTLENGFWWFMLFLPATWLADAGAYFIGSRFGRHALSKRISPHKTWEGYWGGVLVGSLGTLGLSLLWRTWGSPITSGQALVIGVVMGLSSTLGDLAESLFKRQAGVKDSGAILPGHGGFFDRIDSWIWAGLIGYYLVTLIWS